MGESLALTDRVGAVRFTVRVVPRASRSAIDGMHGDALKVRLAAPPVDGAANEELVELLAKVLGLPRSRVRIVGGGHSRSKLVEVEGMDSENVRRILGEGSRGSRSEQRG